MPDENGTVARLIAAMGDDVEYDRPDHSFSPHYSDIGLGFTNDGGIDTLYFHYNRGTTELGGPFLAFDAGAAPDKIETTALGVRQTFPGGSAQVAFYERNSFLVSCHGGVGMRFHLSDERVTEARTLHIEIAGDKAWLFEGYLPSRDKREPDERFPFIIGIRLMSGTADGNGIDAPLVIEPDDQANTKLAVTVNVLEIDHETILEHLGHAPETINEAHALTCQWYGRTLGSLDISADGSDAESVVARAAHTVASNLCLAPGRLAGRVSLFPARGSYAMLAPWDSCFHNLGLEYMETRLAEDSLLLLTDTMRADGKIACFVACTWDRPILSQPPLVGWAAERLWHQRGNREFVRAILPKLWRNCRWWLTQRMTKHGLIGCPHGIEAGWDNSPRWDKGPILATDMNSHLLSQLHACERFAMEVGDMTLAEKARAEIESLSAKMMDILYDPDDNLFWDVVNATGEKVKVLTPSAFLPVWAGIGLPEDKARRMIEDVLLDPERLFGEIPFPCVAYDEEVYDPPEYWRGPTWMPVAWLMMELLEQYGYAEQRGEAADRLYRMCVADGDLREWFNSQTGEGRGAHQQGWTAAIFLRLKMEREGKLPGTAN